MEKLCEKDDHIVSPFFESLVDLLSYRAQQHPDKVAFTFLQEGEVEAGHLSYAGLHGKAIAIATHLQSVIPQHIALSASPAPRAILLYGANDVLDFTAALFGCLYAGIIAVPTYPPRKERQWSEFERRIEDCDIHMALTTAALCPRLEQSWEKRSQPRSVLRPLIWAATDTLNIQPVESLQPSALHDTSAWQPSSIKRDTVAYLQHTSGSTGIPKGVIVTHGNVLCNSEMIRQSFQSDASLRVLFWLPFNHDMGLVGGIMQVLYTGGTAFFMSSTAFVQKPVRWLKAISHYRITVSGGPNFAYDLLCQRVTDVQRKSLDLSSWSVAFCGAEPVRAKTLDNFSTQFADCGFRVRAFSPCYGMAEATLLVSGGEKTALPMALTVNEQALRQDQVVIADAETAGGRSLVSCGHSWFESQIRIVNPETRQPCNANEVGEIWVQGTGIGKGYWNHPQATKQTFQAYIANSDTDDSGTDDSSKGPFLRTGDLGFLHGKDLFVTGRLKEVIKFWGGGIYPQHLEETLEALHPMFLARGGAAFSVEENGAERVVIVQALTRQACRSLSDRQVKHMVRKIRRALLIRHFVDVYAIAFLKPGGLPKTTSGKIQRRLCAQQFLAEELPAIEQWTCPPGKEFNYARWSGWAMALDKFNLLSKVRDV